jgi:hypothetical protein
VEHSIVGQEMPTEGLMTDDELEALLDEQEALLADVLGDPTFSLKGDGPPLSECFDDNWDGLARWYAHYSDSMGPRDAALMACKSAMDSAQFDQYIDHLEKAERIHTGWRNKQVDDLAKALEPGRKLIGEVQPRELARRGTLSLVDAAEAWAVDGASWQAPYDEVEDCWVMVARNQIAEGASRAWTRTGSMVKLDQAKYVIQRVRAHHQAAHDAASVNFCDKLLEQLEID